jgi:hypothetical protein
MDKEVKRVPKYYKFRADIAALLDLLGYGNETAYITRLIEEDAERRAEELERLKRRRLERKLQVM